MPPPITEQFELVIRGGRPDARTAAPGPPNAQPSKNTKPPHLPVPKVLKSSKPARTVWYPRFDSPAFSSTTCPTAGSDTINRLSRLPGELVCQILDSCDAVSLARLQTTSRFFRDSVANEAPRLTAAIRKRETQRHAAAMTRPSYKGWTLEACLRDFVSRAGVPKERWAFWQFSKVVAQEFDVDNSFPEPGKRRLVDPACEIEAMLFVDHLLRLGQRAITSSDPRSTGFVESECRARLGIRVTTSVRFDRFSRASPPMPLHFDEDTWRTLSTCMMRRPLQGRRVAEEEKTEAELSFWDCRPVGSSDVDVDQCGLMLPRALSRPATGAWHRIVARDDKVLLMVWRYWHRRELEPQHGSTSLALLSCAVSEGLDVMRYWDRGPDNAISIPRWTDDKNRIQFVDSVRRILRTQKPAPRSWRRPGE